jgi:hypothetical protein
VVPASLRYARYEDRFPAAAAMNTSVAAIQNGPYLASAGRGLSVSAQRRKRRGDAQVWLVLHCRHKAAAKRHAGETHAVQHVRGVHVKVDGVRLEREEATSAGGGCGRLRGGHRREGGGLQRGRRVGHAVAEPRRLCEAWRRAPRARQRARHAQKPRRAAHLSSRPAQWGRRQPGSPARGCGLP